MAWEGIAYSIGHYKGRSSTYDRGGRRKQPVRRSPKERAVRVAVKASIWGILWGFLMFAI